MSRSIKKGPFVQEVLLKRVQAMNEAGEKKVLKTWSRSSTIFPDFVGHMVSSFYNLPDYGWTHLCCARWSQARSGLCNRRYGRSQARRVCTDQNL